MNGSRIPGRGVIELILRRDRKAKRASGRGRCRRGKTKVGRIRRADTDGVTCPGDRHRDSVGRGDRLVTSCL